MDYKKLNETIANFKNDLSGALLSCDIWSKNSGLSVASYNSNETYTALFGRITSNTEKALDELGFPPFGSYQITELEMDTMLLILNLDEEHVWGSVIDITKVKLGALIHIVIPNAKKSFEETGL